MTLLKPRNATVDIAKGLVIILMCVGHSYAPVPITEWFGMFRMPFFFMMSGYFFSPKSLDSPLNFTMKRVKGIYIPFVVWGIIFVLLHNLFLNIGMLSLDSNVYSIKDMLWRGLTTIPRFIPTEDFMGPYWFLSELFYVSIFSFALFYVARLIDKILDGERFNLISSLLFSLMYILGFILKEYLPNIPHYIYRIPIVSLLFFMGYMWRQSSDKIRYNFFIFLVTILIFSVAQYLGLADIGMANSNYGSPIRLIIYAMSGAYLMLFISDKLGKIAWTRVLLSYIGENTLIILILNIFCVRLTHLITFGLRNEVNVNHPTSMAQFNTEWYWWIVYTLVMVVLPLVLQWIYRNAKFAIIGKLKS